MQPLAGHAACRRSLLVPVASAADGTPHRPPAAAPVYTLSSRSQFAPCHCVAQAPLRAPYTCVAQLPDQLQSQFPAKCLATELFFPARMPIVQRMHFALHASALSVDVICDVICSVPASQF